MPWRGPTLLRIALGASLTANLVLGGLMLHPPHPPGPFPGHLETRMASLLPPADRQAFGAAMQGADDEEQTWHRAEFAGREHIRALIGTDAFDAEALRQTMAEHRRGWADFSARFEDRLVRALAAISAEGRRRIQHDMPAPPPEDDGR